MADKSSKPSPNKVKEPRTQPKQRQGSKDRKGGKKARKLAPERRLSRTMARFTGVSNELTEHKKMEADYIRKYVRDGDMQPLSGMEFSERLNRPRHKQVNPRKIAKLLMPNGY